MIRTISIALTLVAGTAAAGDPTDCYNDEHDTNTHYTSIEPEVLRITDADILAMLFRAREQENGSVASAESDSALHISLSSENPASH